MRSQTRRTVSSELLAGVAERYDGGTIKGTERKLKPKAETHRDHTYYVTTREADRILRNLDD